MKTYTKKRITQEPRLEIVYDSGCFSPREDTNLGYFITVDKDYHSPDKNIILEELITYTGDVADDVDDHMKAIKREVKEQTGETVIAIYSIVKYEHSGINYSLGTKHGFDYSNNGFYIVTDKTQKETGVKKKDFKKCIVAELDIYNKYVNGETYAFTLYDEKGEIEDNCNNFYSIEDIQDYLPKEWKNEKLMEYFNDNY